MIILGLLFINLNIVRILIHDIVLLNIMCINIVKCKSCYIVNIQWCLLIQVLVILNHIIQIDIVQSLDIVA